MCGLGWWVRSNRDSQGLPEAPLQADVRSHPKELLSKKGLDQHQLPYLSFFLLASIYSYLMKNFQANKGAPVVGVNKGFPDKADVMLNT